MAQTPAQRSEKARKARKEQGLVRCEVWVKPHHKADIKALELELNKGYE